MQTKFDFVGHGYEKAFKRHLRDLEDVKSDKKSYLRYSEKIGKLYIGIIEQLKFTKGEKANQNFILEDWQKKVISIAFGWLKKNEDGEWVRRFNTVFIYIPRKNGKTELAGGIVIADMIIRGEVGGEVAFFATKRDQAKIPYEVAKKMIFSNKELSQYASENYAKIRFKKNETTLYTLGRDSKTLDGLNISIGVCEEYHAHPNNDLYDVVKSSQGARKEPLMFIITTAGFNLSSPAVEMYQYAKKVLDGVIEDDNFFAFIAEAKKRKGLDWIADEKTWKEANPNYGVSLKKDFFKREADDAIQSPSRLNNSLVKHLNIWTNASENFIPLDKWEKCKVEELPEYESFVFGNDLSLIDDFSALVEVGKVKDSYVLKPRFYIPSERIKEREKELKAPLYSWVQQGYITATPGRVIDYNFIQKDIETNLQNCEAFCYDPWKAAVIVNRLQTELGYDMCIPIRQGYATLSAPTKWFLDLVIDGKIIHDGNPVLTWMISNAMVKTDINGNIMLDKHSQNQKIDGVAATINALAYFIHKPKEEQSIYEGRGLRNL
jgi:phage terminase large subunit-like protein